MVCNNWLHILHSRHSVLPLLAEEIFLLGLQVESLLLLETLYYSLHLACPGDTGQLWLVLGLSLIHILTLPTIYSV